METRNQRLIRQILNEKDDSADTSLQAQALRRARSGEAPRTLTPFEWEQWQAEHGVPPSLKQGTSQREDKPGLLKRLLGRG
jgi:hypothetical protein